MSIKDSFANNLLSWRGVVVAIVIYAATLGVYRLFLHPLARFPGPKLAALTRYYEAYYDLIQNGQYTFKIAKLHEKYGTILFPFASISHLRLESHNDTYQTSDMEIGPIIRISPHELHVIDPTFYEKLYRHDGRWHKYDWAYDAFTAKGALICTIDHDVHKARRAPLNPFFAKTKVTTRGVEVIRHNLDKLYSRLSAFAATKPRELVMVGAALSAFSRDVSTEFALNRNYGSLDHDDFNVSMTNVFQDSGYVWRMTKHVRFFGPMMLSIPKEWLVKIADPGTKGFFRYLLVSLITIKTLSLW